MGHCPRVPFAVSVNSPEAGLACSHALHPPFTCLPPKQPGFPRAPSRWSRQPSVIFEDNKACISISTGDTDKKRTKHIAKHWHFVREKCAAGLVVLKYLETALQVADMFTKQIFPKHFERLRRVMMGHENFDDMQARYAQVKASGDDMDDPKLYVDSKPGGPPK